MEAEGIEPSCCSGARFRVSGGPFEFEIELVVPVTHLSDGVSVFLKPEPFRMDVTAFEFADEEKNVYLVHKPNVRFERTT